MVGSDVVDGNDVVVGNGTYREELVDIKARKDLIIFPTIRRESPSDKGDRNLRLGGLSDE